jgi:hypothetical protein
MFEEEAFSTIFILTNCWSFWLGYRLYGRYSIDAKSFDVFRRLSGYGAILIGLSALYWFGLVPVLNRVFPIFDEAGRSNVVNMFVVTAIPCGCWLLPGSIRMLAQRIAR